MKRIIVLEEQDLDKIIEGKEVKEVKVNFNPYGIFSVMNQKCYREQLKDGEIKTSKRVGEKVK